MTNEKSEFLSPDIEKFASELRGKLITSSYGDYEQTQKVLNGMIDKLPAMIALCTDVADVIAAINFGRENRIP